MIIGRSGYTWACIFTQVLALFSVSLLTLGNAYAAETPFKPAVLFQGEMQSGSFLQIIDSGINRFESKTGSEVHRIRLAADSELYIENLQAAAQAGYSPIIVHDSNNIESFPSLAKQFPSTQFISLDVAYHVPNVLGLTFNHAEGAYIIGYLAGLKTQSNKVGFIGGLDIPVINHFRCGYELGIKDANPQATLMTKYVDNGAFSWDDIKTASDLAEQLLADGADILFPVTGYASVGVMNSVKDHGASFSFGIDNDYSSAFPNSSLASLEKHVDVAIFAALMQLYKGIWNGNQKHFGIKQGVIAITLNEHNSSLTEADLQIARKLQIDLKGKSNPTAQRIDQFCAETL